MLVFVARRIGWAAIVLVAVSSITFLLTFIAPGDPARAIAGPRASAEAVERIRETLGLDRAPLEQLLSYFGRLLQGDLGYSYEKQAPVLDLIVARLPATIELAVAAVALSVAVGVPLGVAAARRPGGWVDRLGVVTSSILVAIPTFVVGYVLLYFLAFRPAVDLGIEPFPIYTAGFDPLDLRALFLPALTLAATGIAFYTRLARTAMLDELHHGYVRTARAKGASDRRVAWRHAFRNAVAPILTQAGLDIGLFVGGVFVVEAVFSWPGIGQLAIDSIDSEDLALLMGTVLVATVGIVLANLLVDIAYAIVDPRVGHETVGR